MSELKLLQQWLKVERKKTVQCNYVYHNSKVSLECHCSIAYVTPAMSNAVEPSYILSLYQSLSNIAFC